MISRNQRRDARSAVAAAPPAFALAAIAFVLALTTSLASAASATGDEPAAVTELRFRDFFRMPVGPRGLEPSSQLVALDGRSVRIRGYVVRQAERTPGLLILSPLPVELGDADESLSDDLPPAVVFVHFDASAPDVAGLVQVTGTLDLGARDEADGHVSQVRLQLSAVQAAAIEPIPVPVTASVTAPRSSQ
jgi:hypothetical protein